MENEETETSPSEADEQATPETGGSNLSDEEKTWGMLAHLSGLAGLVGVPFGNILGPLVVWLVKKDEMAFVEREGKEALNFQISVAIYGFVAALLTLVLIGLLLLPIIFLAYLVLTIMGAVKAKEGNHYEYPLTIRLIS